MKKYKDVTEKIERAKIMAQREKDGEEATPEIRALARELDVHPFWMENLLSMQPKLQADGQFLLGMFRINGALSGWVLRVDGGEIWRNEEVAEFGDPANWHDRIDAIQIASDLIGKGWGLVVYSRNDQDEILKHIAYSKRAGQDKTYKEMTEVIAKANIIVSHDGTPCTTAEQVWAALPKNLFELRLGEWYSAALAKEAA